MDLEEGYYKIHYQDWFETSESKTGWEGTGWNEDEGFELVDYLETDKFDHPTKALFKYDGAVFLGKQQAALNIQSDFLFKLIEIYKSNEGKLFQELYKEDENFRKINDCIDLLEEEYKIKEYRNGR